MKRHLTVALVLALTVAPFAHPCFGQTGAQPDTGNRKPGGLSAQRETLNAQPETVSPAATALFVNSNLDSARSLAAATLRRQPNDIDSLFVEMEAAALEADTSATLEAALRLCESHAEADTDAKHDSRTATRKTQSQRRETGDGRSGTTNDPRLTIAAARIVDLAGNTPVFRAAIPRLQRLIAADVAYSSFLRAALIAAAGDGAPEAAAGVAAKPGAIAAFSPLTLARQSGLVTDWRVAGPFGTYANVAFDRPFGPERDALASAAYDGHAVERFRFDDGNFVLPDYFSLSGVFYAASDVSIAAAGQYRLRAETAGSLELWIDGVSSLRKDDRFRATPEIASSTLRLSAGSHRVLVKFMPSTAPFRIALLPADKRAITSPPPVIAPAEAAYVAAAERYWLGDYSRAIELLSLARRRQPSASVDFLLAQAWSRAAQDSPEQAQLFASALKAAPLALAAEYELAARALDADRIDEAFDRAQRIAAARPDFADAQALLAQAAIRLKSAEQAQHALDAELALHPSCTALRKAARYYSSISAFARAAQVEAQLKNCAPASLAYAESLSDAGRHTEAAAAAAKLATERPLDREVRALLVRELLLAGNRGAAQQAARELVALAPNSAAYRSMAEQVASGSFTVDRPAARAQAFTPAPDFYTAYRRSAVEYIQHTAGRRFAGGPAVTILYDRVTQLGADGRVSLYVHQVTRMLNRDGIERYGEVALPRGADLLELRTIKVDGTIAEPEFNQHKKTISMPALAPGDAIDVEYTLRYPGGGIAEHPQAFTYTFGSFTAPILYARFAVLSPTAGENLQMTATAGAPSPTLTTADGWNARVWEQENIAQSAEEVAAPTADVLPTVHVLAAETGGWYGLRDFYRSALIDASRIGSRVETTAQQLRGATPEDTARNLYRAVTTRLRSTGNNFSAGEIASAENTLANYSGSRTAALLALARAAGLDAELLLARDIGHPRPALPARDTYTHPLVLFRFGGKQVIADAESDGIAFGVLPPTIAHEDALAIPLTEAAAQQRAAVVPVPASAADEHSFADADVAIDAQGNLTARVHIRMGAARSAQMRSILSAVPPSGRKHFFEQTAMRIFPGATDADGEVRHESDPEQPLELDITCRAPRFVHLAAAADMEQLAPALGLRKMYGLGPRRAPLYIDTALIETAVFRVHLPAGVRVRGIVPDLRIDNEFGSYSLSLRLLGEDGLEVRRAFRIPVQVVAPENFDSFAHFARLVDDAERQRLSLARVPAATLASGK